MDSGNTSGSLQSSSGGDEEYDSRSDHHSLQFPSFLTGNPSSSAAATAHFGYASSANQNLSSSPLSLHNLPSTVLFDPSTSYLQSLSSQPQSNSLLNMDFLRPRGGLPQRSGADLGNFSGGSPSMSMFGNQGSFMNNPSPLMQPRSSLIQDNGAASQHGKFPTSPSSDHQGPLNQSTTTLGVRNLKKRTRASRRAPTTVLTTDTSNFRAMVQEFTGIPAPPFSGSSYSRRLDLFGSSSLRSGHLEPFYPLRPSAQKIHPSANPFLASDSSTPSLLLNSSHFLDNAGNTGSASNYLNLQNPILSFQSLLQPPTHDPSQQMLSSSSLLGLGQSQHQNQNQQQQVNVSSGEGWSGGAGSSHHQVRVSGDQGGYNNSSAQQERSNNNNDGRIFSYTPAPPDFDHQSSSQSPAPRPDGTVDSWICPSD